MISITGDGIKLCDTKYDIRVLWDKYSRNNIANNYRNNSPSKIILPRPDMPWIHRIQEPASSSRKPGSQSYIVNAPASSSGMAKTVDRKQELPKDDQRNVINLFNPKHYFT